MMRKLLTKAYFRKESYSDLLHFSNYRLSLPSWRYILLKYDTLAFFKMSTCSSFRLTICWLQVFIWEALLSIRDAFCPMAAYRCLAEGWWWSWAFEKDAGYLKRSVKGSTWSTCIIEIVWRQIVAKLINICIHWSHFQSSQSLDAALVQTRSSPSIPMWRSRRESLLESWEWLRSNLWPSDHLGSRPVRWQLEVRHLPLEWRSRSKWSRHQPMRETGAAEWWCRRLSGDLEKMKRLVCEGNWHHQRKASDNSNGDSLIRIQKLFL